MQQFGPHCLQLSNLNQFQEFKNHFFSYAAVTQYMTWTYCMNFIMKSKPNMLRMQQRYFLNLRPLTHSGTSITCLKIMGTNMCINNIKNSTFV